MKTRIINIAVFTALVMLTVAPVINCAISHNLDYTNVLVLFAALINLALVLSAPLALGYVVLSEIEDYKRTH